MEQINRDHVVFRATLYDIKKLYERAEELSKFEQNLESDKGWINIHKSSPILDHIVSKANHLAGGEEDNSKIDKKNIKRTYLEPLLGKISLTGERKKTEYRFPLEALDEKLHNLFPSADFSLEKLTEDYKKLANGLKEPIKKFLECRDSNFESLRAAYSTLLSQFERGLIFVPSAAANADMPLLDLLKVRTAIAEGALSLPHSS